MILSEGFERFQNEASLYDRIILPERRLQFSYEIAKQDGILLILGMVPMGRLITFLAIEPWFEPSPPLEASSPITGTQSVSSS